MLNLDDAIVFDCEGDGLYPTKFHCLFYNDNPINQINKTKGTPKYEEMREFLKNADILVGHNIIRWDIVQLERLLNIKIKAYLIDTLAISWYIEPNRVIHGLESYGEEYGVPKPKIIDWENQTLEEYCHRCAEDVRINSRLWRDQLKKLRKLYGDDAGVERLIRYLMFKMRCAKDQEEYGWKLDVDKATKGLEELEGFSVDRYEELKQAMPNVVKYKDVHKPAKMFLKSGKGLTAAGKKWYALLEEHKLPEDHSLPISVIASSNEPNPGSSKQIKDWLYSLGWKPETFNYVRDKETNEIRKIPQVNSKEEDGVCRSIKKLFDKEPSLRALDGLSIVNHRITILKGFLKSVDENGYIRARVQGFTNTLRFKHTEIVNLPGVDKPYGDLIRGCLTAPEGYELCGSDMSSLEDRTKQHYMYPYDPDYVKEMMEDNFDPHINLAVFAGAVSTEDGIRFREADVEFKHSKQYTLLKGIRHTFKQVNYACVYGAQGPTVARSAGCTVEEGDRLVEAYWKRNWAVKAIANAQKVKVCLGIKWLYNPLSKLWYSLRHEKDIFSTLNQGTGVYCFDTWVSKLKVGGPPIIGQMHDEVIALIRVGLRDKCTKFFRKAIYATNEQLKLNRELDIDIQFGNNYSEIH